MRLRSLVVLFFLLAASPAFAVSIDIPELEKGDPVADMVDYEWKDGSGEARGIDEVEVNLRMSPPSELVPIVKPVPGVKSVPVVVSETHAARKSGDKPGPKRSGKARKAKPEPKKPGKARVAGETGPEPDHSRYEYIKEQQETLEFPSRYEDWN